MSAIANVAVWPDPADVDVSAFLEGHNVRIRETKGIPYRDGNPRRWFVVYIDEVKSSLMVGGKLKPGTMLCSNHDNPCDCRAVVRKYISTDSE